MDVSLSVRYLHRYLLTRQLGNHSVVDMNSAVEGNFPGDGVIGSEKEIQMFARTHAG